MAVAVAIIYFDFMTLKSTMTPGSAQVSHLLMLKLN